MGANNPVEQLLSEARLLSREERDELIHHLISEKLHEERTPDKIEELPDGTVRQTYWARPEERRGKTLRQYDLFMGHLEVAYRPPAKRDYIRLGLEHCSGIPRRYFQPPPRDLINNFFSREMSEQSAEDLIKQLAKKKGISPQTFIIFVNDTIEKLTEKLFWELDSRYDKAIREVQSNLMHEIELPFSKKIGIHIQVAQKKDDVMVVEELSGQIIERKIEHPKHRPQKSKHDQQEVYEEFKEQLTWILFDLVSSGKLIEEITLPFMCARLIPVIGEIGEKALRVRLRKCGIKNWPKFRESLVCGWKNKGLLFLELEDTE